MRLKRPAGRCSLNGYCVPVIFRKVVSLTRLDKWTTMSFRLQIWSHIPPGQSRKSRGTKKISQCRKNRTMNKHNRRHGQGHCRGQLQDPSLRSKKIHIYLTWQTDKNVLQLIFFSYLAKKNVKLLIRCFKHDFFTIKYISSIALC